MKFHEYQITPTSLLPAVAIALAAGIFIADTTTESEIAFPVFYTAIVLIAARFCTKRGIIFVGLGCIGLILLSDILTIDVSSIAGRNCEYGDQCGGDRCDDLPCGEDPG